MKLNFSKGINWNDITPSFPLVLEPTPVHMKKNVATLQLFSHPAYAIL